MMSGYFPKTSKPLLNPWIPACAGMTETQNHQHVPFSPGTDARRPGVPQEAAYAGS